MATGLLPTSPTRRAWLILGGAWALRLATTTTTALILTIYPRLARARRASSRVFRSSVVRGDCQARATRSITITATEHLPTYRRRLASRTLSVTTGWTLSPVTLMATAG